MFNNTHTPIGLADVLPLSQPFPIPRFNPLRRKLLIRVGDPIDFDDAILKWRKERSLLDTNEEKEALDQRVRIEIVDLLQKKLAALKKSSEHLLNDDI